MNFAILLFLLFGAANVNAAAKPLATCSRQWAEAWAATAKEDKNGKRNDLLGSAPKEHNCASLKGEENQFEIAGLIVDGFSTGKAPIISNTKQMREGENDQALCTWDVLVEGLCKQLWDAESAAQEKAAAVLAKPLTMSPPDKVNPECMPWCRSDPNGSGTRNKAIKSELKDIYPSTDICQIKKCHMCKDCPDEKNEKIWGKQAQDTGDTEGGLPSKPKLSSAATTSDNDFVLFFTMFTFILCLALGYVCPGSKGSVQVAFTPLLEDGMHV